ncbi:MAG: hypothetical protein ABIN01_24520 [Ferruginibacter sp.]
MADVHSAAIRSYNMSRIKGKDTKPEMLVRRFLHAHGFRYRLHDKKLPGKPDRVLSKYKTVIFVHRCCLRHISYFTNHPPVKKNVVDQDFVIPENGRTAYGNFVNSLYDTTLLL